MPMLPGRRRRPDDRPIPDHPYRDTALVYAGMAVVLVIVASVTGGQPFRAAVAATLFFVIATAWTWWRFRKRIRERDEAEAAEAAARGAQRGRGRSMNGNGHGGPT
jgi:membrane protein implicated in regulation of membrane protease activity